jgi:hypothetical protein
MHRHKRKAIAQTQGRAGGLERLRRLSLPMLAAMALLIVGSGVTALVNGRLGYYNYAHLVVYAPFAILVGLAFLLVAILKRNKS